MTEQIFTFVSLSIAALPPPANTDAGACASAETASCTVLVGAGLLIAQRIGTRWRFRNEVTTVSAAEKEQKLLLWLADQLPMADTFIGWHIDRQLMPALIAAAGRAEPALAHHFMQRVARAARCNVVDLSIDHDAADVPGGKEAWVVSSMAPSALRKAWRSDRLDALRADLANEALGSWLLFLRQAQQGGLEPTEATRAWMHRRASIHLVEDGPVSGLSGSR